MYLQLLRKQLVAIRNLAIKVGELKAGIVERLSRLHPVFSIFRVHRRVLLQKHGRGLLSIFKSAGKKNYGKEAVNLSAPVLLHLL